VDDSAPLSFWNRAEEVGAAPASPHEQSVPQRFKPDETDPSKQDEKQDSTTLLRVSLVAMVALALHNFPEGLAAFFSASSAKMSIVIAIAMHNIPEGAAIAVPIYQGTKSYWKAFLTTFVAGLAQPSGALVGWAFIWGMGLDQPTDFAYGAIYAATGGIMVAISLMGLLPEAFASATPLFCMFWMSAGFLVMEISIIMLTASE